MHSCNKTDNITSRTRYTKRPLNLSTDPFHHTQNAVQRYLINHYSYRSNLIIVPEKEVHYPHGVSANYLEQSRLRSAPPSPAIRS